MLAQAPIQSFLPVSDLPAAEHFYVAMLGLSVVSNNGFALILSNTTGQQIRLVLTPDAHPQPFTVLGWLVPDLAHAAAALKTKKIDPILYPHFHQSPTGVWTAPNGDQVLWFHDPDQNVLSLTQAAATK